MKALILSAGTGSRLNSMTRNKPKVMIQIAGKPVLWYHIQSLKKHGIKEIWINLHSFPEAIKRYFGDGSKFGVRILYSYEEKLLGTAGALRNPNSEIGKDLQGGTFVVAYGDVLADFDYKKLIDFHFSNNAIWTDAVHLSEEPWTKGVVKIDQKGRIISLIEKGPKGEDEIGLVRAGFMVCEPEIFKYIPDGFSDFGLDLGPMMLSKKLPIYALDTGSYSKDMGTPMRLRKARADVRAGKLNMSTFDL